MNDAGMEAHLVDIWRYKFNETFFLKIFDTNYIVFTALLLKKAFLFNKNLQSEERHQNAI